MLLTNMRALHITLKFQWLNGCVCVHSKNLLSVDMQKGLSELDQLLCALTDSSSCVTRLCACAVFLTMYPA